VRLVGRDVHLVKVLGARGYGIPGSEGEPDTVFALVRGNYINSLIQSDTKIILRESRILFSTSEGNALYTVKAQTIHE
jgi:hypothetical protein